MMSWWTDRNSSSLNFLTKLLVLDPSVGRYHSLLFKNSRHISLYCIVVIMTAFPPLSEGLMTTSDICRNCDSASCWLDLRLSVLRGQKDRELISSVTKFVKVKMCKFKCKGGNVDLGLYSEKFNGEIPPGKDSRSERSSPTREWSKDSSCYEILFSSNNCIKIFTFLWSCALKPLKISWLIAVFGLTLVLLLCNTFSNNLQVNRSKSFIKVNLSKDFLEQNDIPNWSSSIKSSEITLSVRLITFKFCPVMPLFGIGWEPPVSNLFYWASVGFVLNNCLK